MLKLSRELVRALFPDKFKLRQDSLAVYRVRPDDSAVLIRGLTTVNLNLEQLTRALSGETMKPVIREDTYVSTLWSVPDERPITFSEETLRELQSATDSDTLKQEIGEILKNKDKAPSSHSVLAFRASPFFGIGNLYQLVFKQPTPIVASWRYTKLWGRVISINGSPPKKELERIRFNAHDKLYLIDGTITTVGSLIRKMNQYG